MRVFSKQVSGGIGCLALIATMALAGPASAAPFVASQTQHFAGSEDVVTGDFNGDGDADLATLFETSVRILMGEAGATFSAPVSYDLGTGASAIELADVNGDSDLDLIVANYPDANDAGARVALLLGAAGGTFDAASTIVSSYYPMDLEVGDFNGDNDPDVAVVGGSPRVLTGGAGATFTDSGSLNLGGAVLDSGDFNGDGDPDLVAATNGQLDAEVRVVLGGAGASFGTPTYLGASGPASDALLVSDFNGDSDPDIAVAHSMGGNSVSIFLGASGSTFGTPASVPAGAPIETIEAADFTGDGDPDLALVRHESALRIMVGGSGGSFSFGVDAGSSSRGVAIGDFNGDADRDFVLTSGYTFEGFGEVGSITVYAGTEPAAPTALTSSPVSPAKDTTPQISGTAGADDSVRLYTTASCSGTPAATGTSAAFASPGLTATVPAGSTTTFRATAFDGLTASGCSANSVSYREASPSLDVTSSSHPPPGHFVPFTSAGVAGTTSGIFYLATSADATCAASYDAQSPTSQGLGVDYTAAGPYSFTSQGTSGTRRVCVYLYEQETSGVYSGAYDLSQPADAADTVITSNGPVADSDGDGTPDSQDACPSVAGPPGSSANAPGCPAPVQTPPPYTPPPTYEAPTYTPPTYTPPTYPAPTGSFEGGAFDEGEHSFEIEYFVAAKAPLRKFLRTGVVGSMSCLGCSFTSRVKIPATLAKKLRLKSATIGTAKASSIEGTVKLKIRLSTALRAKLAKVTKFVVTVNTTVIDSRAVKTVIAAKRQTLSR